MGKYFVMSKRFNKCNASDFGLVTEGTDVAIDPKDGSVWIKAALYDFGWGKENGFYKSPQPDFDTLIELALHSTDEEDKYGAASILLDKYGDELLRQCENLMNDYSKKEDFKKLIALFNLKHPANRCSIAQKTYEEIQSDYARWEKVSEMARRISR